METCIGRVTHYYNRLGVAVLALTEPLESDAILHLYGHTTDFYQKAWSIEIDHIPVTGSGTEREVALKVVEPVREGDQVLRVTEDKPGEIDSVIREQMERWE